MRGSDFIFDLVQRFYYKCYKIKYKRGRGVSYIGSPDWAKQRKATINPKNTDDKCFQYAVTLTVSEIKKNFQY